MLLSLTSSVAGVARRSRQIAPDRKEIVWRSRRDRKDRAEIAQSLNSLKDVADDDDGSDSDSDDNSTAAQMHRHFSKMEMFGIPIPGARDMLDEFD